MGKAFSEKTPATCMVPKSVEIGYALQKDIPNGRSGVGRYDGVFEPKVYR